MNDLISVIIPLYNAENTIKRCLDSLLKQSYKNLQIIIVNDGSVDNSEKICKEISQSDSRILYISKDNSGVGEARNRGLKESKGEYLCFVDADDYVKEDYIEVLYKLLVDENADLSICGYIEIKENNILSETKGTMNKYSQKEAMEELLKENSFRGYVWNKMFRLNVIRENKLLFNTDIPVWEDVIFVFQYMKYIEKVVYNPIAEYYYVYFDNSSSHMDNHILGVEKAFSAIKAKDIIANDIPNDYKEVRKQLNLRYIKTALSVIRNIGYTDSLDNKVYLKKSMEIIKRYNKEVWRYLSKKEKILIMICKINPGILIGLYKRKK